MEEIRKIIEAVTPDGGASASSFDPEERVRLMCKAYNELPGRLHETDGYHCPECNNKGLVSVPFLDDAGYWREQSVYCKCRKIRRSIRRINASGLKHILGAYTFEAFKTETLWQKAIKEAALRFVEDGDHSWFFIGGATGCGKSHICTAIAGEYLKRGKDVRYLLWRDDVGKLRGNADPAEREKAMGEFKTAEVLYIDDLFKSGRKDGEPQAPTVSDVNVAFELLNHRYNNPTLVTVISSECRTPDILNIDEAVGGRIVERAVRHGYGINVNPDRTKNYRLKGAIEL